MKAWPQFDLSLIIKKQATKSSRRDQAHFLPIQNLDAGYKRFNRLHMSDYVALVVQGNKKKTLKM